MKKILQIYGVFFIFELMISCGALAGDPKCITFACPKGKKIGVNTEYIQSYVGGDQCYSCDSNDFSSDDQECDYGAIVMQADKYDRGVGLYQCVDVSWDAYDEWRTYNPGVLCQGARELSGPHIVKYFLNKGQATTAQPSGDNIVRLAGHDACYYYDCDDPQKYEIRGDECVEKGKKDANICYTKVNGTDVQIPAGQSYGNGTLLSKQECATASGSTPDPNGTKFELRCTSSLGLTCCPINCAQGKIPDTTNCVCRSTGVIVDKSCTEKRKDKPIGVACCNLENAKLATYDAKKDVCTCKDASRTFAIDQSNGTGMCVDNTPVKPDCDESTGAHLNEKTNKCECPSAELTLNADGVSCSCVDPDKVYKNGKCVYTEEYLLRIKITQIREIRARLDGIMSGLKVSVWKDEEGNFNTARLASDSIAGVVLGTVGGVVTSVVVKKNQIKKGFEAIQCAIGGQTVANYGDEFVVGPAR